MSSKGDNHTYMSLGPTPPVTACSPVEKHFSFRSRLNHCWQTKSQPYIQLPTSAVNSTTSHISATQICSAGSYQNHHWSIIVPSLCNTKRISRKNLSSHDLRLLVRAGRGWVGKNKKAKKRRSATRTARLRKSASTVVRDACTVTF